MSTGRGTDPTWIRVAERCYALGLSLFSSSHQREYGDLMRQAFRDRCREVARGERSAWRTVVLELTPDLVSNIGRENMSSIFGDMRPRQVMLLGLLILSSAYFLFGEAMGLRLSDLAVTIKQQVDRVQNQHEVEELRTRFHGVAEPLAVGSTAQSKALAALVYRFTELSTDWIRLDEGDHSDAARAVILSRAALAGQVDPYLLAMSARQCWPWDCDLAGVTRRMLELTPDKGYAWALEYRLAVLAKSPTRMRRALGGLAASRYYNTYEGRVARDVLAAVQAHAPDDAVTLAAVASALVSSGRGLSVRLGTFCDPADPGSLRFGFSPAEIEAARDDCVRAGRVMASSTQLDVASRGEKIVQNLSNSPAERAAAEARGRELDWLASQLTLNEKNHAWMYSDSRRVDMWLASSTADEGEIPSARRWVRNQAVPPPSQH